MTSHVLEWLGAYHDGELTAGRRRQVEDHLRDCSTCREELESLNELSSLLKADPPSLRTSPQRFAAHVQLRLPHQSARSTRRNTGQLPRWVLGAPLVLIGIWAFLQSALWVASLVLAADWALGPRVMFFSNWITAEGWLESMASLFLLHAGLLIGTAILWTTWMAFWWAWKQSLNFELSSNQIQKEV